MKRRIKLQYHSFILHQHHEIIGIFHPHHGSQAHLRWNVLSLSLQRRPSRQLCSRERDKSIRTYPRHQISWYPAINISKRAHDSFMLRQTAVHHVMIADPGISDSTLFHNALMFPTNWTHHDPKFDLLAIRSGHPSRQAANQT